MNSNNKVLLAIFWPFGALVSALRNWRQPWAMHVFWVVCIYLGAIQIYHPEGTVLGDGPDSSAPDYYDKCRREAGNNCYFTGWINHDDPLMASAYAAAKVVVLPSHHEIFGNAIFEGAMTGSNIVATNVLPLKEFGFASNAIAIDPNDVAGIRKAIVEAYNSDNDVEFADFVKRKYSLAAIFNEHLKVYKSL